MTIEDKTFLLNICQMPRLGLSPHQISEIERIIDGRGVSLDALTVSYSQAAEVLGFKSKHSVKTIEKYIREGRLVRTSKGRVTIESVKNFGKAVA